ncbi:MAG TPA: helix-turn-helix domain-containing protein [Rhizomicrobium sp.]|jgi:transcriptional regulator with XRE-family HTH domain|nr:helix-turn-helix domain-containing protein [Rhizomicrobium sp.]
MALFFDSAWFDARLAAAGLARADVGTALGLSVQQVAELWKDQREVSADNVRVLAALLAVPAAEIAARAGISTPVPKDAAQEVATVSELNARLARIEQALAEIKALVRDLRGKPP